MNNPMSRKLFQTREAREKLRGMGGILASSPELSQTVARFRDGMMVNATPFDQIAQLVPNMSQEEMVAAGMPSLGLPRREIVELFERVDPNIGPEEFAAMSRQERIAAGFSSLGALNEAYFAARARLLESQFPEQGPSMPPPVPTTSLSPENFINLADEFAGVAADSYQLPEAVITLKQGAGRLIRDETDRGVLMICDRRVVSRGYGRRILDSLPPMIRTRSEAAAVSFFRASPPAPATPAVEPE